MGNTVEFLDANSRPTSVSLADPLPTLATFNGTIGQVQEVGWTTSSPINVSVDDSKAWAIVAANANRNVALIVNKGPKVCYLSSDPVALAADPLTGFPLYVSGACYWPGKNALYAINAAGETSVLRGEDGIN